MKTITILTPVYNEEKNILLFYNSLVNFFSKNKNYYFDILFTDNASTDNTLIEISKLASFDTRVHCISYIKNYGYERSIYTGICNINSDALIFLDVDLEDPVYIINDFLTYYEKGYEYIYGVREHRAESFALSLCRKSFYKIISSITGITKSHNVGNFSLISSRVINILKQINDPEPYIRGILFSLNLKSKAIPYSRETRLHGKSKFSFFKLCDFAALSIINSFKSPALLPIRASFVVLLISLFFILFYFVSKFLYGDNWPPGFASLIIISLLIIFINTFFFGLFGFYIVKIYKILESKNVTIVSHKIN